jgi:hypothetical protein
MNTTVSKSAFRSKQQVLDAIQGARQTQEHMWDAWFTVHDVDSDEFESARLAYMDANLEVNRLMEIYNILHRQR